LEPWEKALVDGETYPQTVHGEVACTDCHNGLQDTDKNIAHTDLNARPSSGSAAVCSECHEDQTEARATSLHATQEGYWTVLEARGATREEPAMHEMFGNHCAGCHTSCGDCHVSQPASVGGGLLDGHNFTEKPPMSRTCTACHGSRIGSEFLGKHEGLRPDVHFRQERMTCTDCHSGESLHGQPVTDEGDAPNHRYDGAPETECKSCHLSGGSDDIMMHEMHGDKLSCQVCHSISYTSCDSCHVAISETSGNPFFETADSYLTFLIGRNPLQSEDRPYEYVPLRHVPVDPDSFSFYGEDLLPDFDAQPTWRYTTPHNIQRETPQTESCNACHGNPDLFLTADKVAPEELNANLPVIVDTIPDLR
jgi:thiosulfate/3-mercaptopyruvate sulfurtransferase